MTPERHRQISDLFDAALKLEPARRTALLGQACDGDPDLRQEIESLIASHENAGEFIAAPALEVAAQALAMDTSQSKTVGNYEVLSHIGTGGMGEVYLARDKRLGRQVALKFLPEEFQDDSDRRARLLTEAQAASLLHSPYIAHL